MCGIAGFSMPGAGYGREALESLAGAMADGLAHRGPDARGAFADPSAGLGLGHRRLSILDLSPQGAQPMGSADGRFTLIHNGEIYNFLDLRAELETLGGPFLPWRGGSDTEVMLAAFGAWGVVPSLERFTGMFALALWDAQERKLFLARDRMGEKPLYYGTDEGAFLFGSELKSLRAFPGFSPVLDMDAVALYLRYQYVPEPRSILAGVSKLPPGTWLVHYPDTGETSAPEAYWSLRRVAERGAAAPYAGGLDAATDQLETLLRSVVRNQMLSDVPLGALLSGGIDSSLVAALMQAESSRPVKTFTIGFEDRQYDESAQAAAVAAHLGCEHTGLTATPDQILAMVDSLPEHYDEPFADASQLPTLLVARLTRQHVTVCLTGDGGDEVFAGYNRHYWAPALWNRISTLPSGLRKVVAAGLQGVSPALYDRAFEVLGLALPRSMRVRTPGYKMHRLAEVLTADSREEVYRRLVSTWPDPAGVLRRGGEPRTLLDSPKRWPGAGATDFTRWMQFMDSSTYLPGDILHKVDRATMAVGLESRAPYLDHRVVEFAWRLPMDFLLQGSRGKIVLRRVLDRFVPRELVERPKAGFGVPIEHWLRGPLAGWAGDLLSSDRLRAQGLFRPEVVQAQWKDHLSGRRDNQYRLWNMLMFQAWADRWGCACA